MTAFRYMSALLGGTSLLGIAASAHAQTATAQGPTPATVQSATDPALNETNSAQPAEIVVTGSRVIQNGNSSPTPVTVVGVDDLVGLKPGPVSEALSSLPDRKSVV